MAAKAKSSKSSTRKSSASSRKSAAEKDAQQLRRVDRNANVPNDPAHFVGLFARVAKGDEQGAYGVVTEVAERDENLIPTKVIMRTRDDDSRRIEVNYADLEAAQAGRY